MVFVLSPRVAATAIFYSMYKCIQKKISGILSPGYEKSRIEVQQFLSDHLS